ncbi:ribosomal maturation YjgA family protein [Polluticaenibacter yanchengensis]|uniref:DUF2809 domain-containing protein n=1 Tax=Polluticaenibacter yanchengensis TaxID=3014562 RepID=A0ABT4UN70_9BACT|nr:DUF2809 domain-containing protein [Chitinophagaceae bacterium LY-5]
MVLLIIEIIIGVYIHDRFIRPFVGDILVVVLIFCFLYSFIKWRVKLLLLGIFIFSVLAEVLQYFKIADVLGIDNKILRVMIGTAFSWWDIVCYAVGIAVLWMLYERRVIS